MVHAWQLECEWPGLTKSEAKAHRMLAARLNYLTQTNPLAPYLSGESSSAGRRQGEEACKVPQGFGPGQADVPVAVRRGGVEDQGVRGQRLGGVPQNPPVDAGWHDEGGQPSLDDVDYRPANDRDIAGCSGTHRHGRGGVARRRREGGDERTWLPPSARGGEDSHRFGGCHMFSGHNRPWEDEAPRCGIVVVARVRAAGKA